jgi:hypothetical protein
VFAALRGRNPGESRRTLHRLSSAERLDERNVTNLNNPDCASEAPRFPASASDDRLLQVGEPIVEAGLVANEEVVLLIVEAERAANEEVV